MEGNVWTAETVSIIQNEDIVNELFSRNFASLTHDDKIIVKNNGRPMPKMPLLINTATGGGGSNRSFNVSWY